MPFLYLDAAVALMARERLRQLRDGLRAKFLAAPGTATLLEERIAYLADHAYRMMNVQPHPPADHFIGGVRARAGERPGQFLLMGAVGPSITAYASLFAEGQSWLVDTLRKGTPDEHRERVVAHSVTLPFEFWTRVQSAVNAGSASADVKTLRLDQARAFVLGNLCHVAAELVASPYIDDVTFHAATPSRAKTFTRAEVVGKLDEAIRAEVLTPAIARKDPDISRWWPTASDVPAEFFPAYADAIRAVHLREGRPQGLGEFERRFGAYPTLPEVSGALVADGYTSFRSILSTGYDWSYWKWFGVLTGMFAPLMLSVPMYALLPEGKKVHDAVVASREKAWFEVVGLQYSALAIVPPLYTLFIAATTSIGFTTQAVLGLVLGGVLLVPAVSYFVSLGVEMSDGVRWGLLLVVPFVLEAAFAVYVFIVRGSEKYHKLLASTFLIHGFTALIGLGFVAIPPFGKWLAKGPGDALWWAAMGLLSVVVFPCWAFTAWVLSKRFAIPVPEDPFPVAQRHFARVFDDASLYGDLGQLTPDLAQLSFPSGNRRLLTLWWTGAGSMWVRSRRDHLEFSVDGAAVTTTVLAPLAPTTLTEYAAYLSRAVREAAPATGVLMAAPAFTGDAGFVLAPGEVFIDYRDEDRSGEDAGDRSAAGFRKLGAANDDDAYVLAHAPRAYQSIRYGARGPVSVEAARVGTLAGPGVISTDAALPNGVAGDAATTFWTFFRVGDHVQIGANPRRVVAAVTADNQLATNLPLAGLPAAAAPGVAYQRIVDDRTEDSAPLGTLQTVPLFPGPFTPPPANAFVPTNVLTWITGPDFAENLVAGDVIRVLPAAPLTAQERRVLSVDSPTQITIDMPFAFNEPAFTAPPLPPPVGSAPLSYLRVGREAVDGLAFVGGPEIDLQGSAVMEQAGDLAALLCLGGASRLLDPQQRRPGAAGYPGAGEMTKVVQVFRNWNLDRRRLNEWRMLVAGGAVSEKRGDFAADDSAMLAPEPGWAPQSTAGEPTALRMGWVPLFRHWTEMATTAGELANAPRAFRPGDPSNLDLSRAMAFVLDMPEPGP